MQTINVEFQWCDAALNDDLHLPVYETSGSAGMDVEAAVATDVMVAPHEIVLIPSGFMVAIPDGFEIQVRPRSGLAVRHGITIINSPGTIDSDYRGEVKIGLINLGQNPYCIRRGERIAQLVLAPVVQARFEVVTELDKTDRGDGGFGHTGL